ncbi:poly(R)-hydroxyalkanoic acid synthase subunit PhaE [Candidatus Nitrosotalea okcheonensis]|uniref:Poly(3-hydroxyalkanoate) polymerase subunit PhaE n=1 Tax=Candidatus Nitrosotalea okcheonensis TaxID=1903276 RepID=A0A2H1FCM0_9ARCH|nr:poly(R)-hydroxyalkanoic acid synthase subunit PhaE [Candidatus Nitrosotalea okcheonensis]SMH70501.1 Poly(R)-hydroxyalkanoic acid synthase, PhaE subunit [Candidatus Nitrosotalea okcheonensis]
MSIPPDFKKSLANYKHNSLFWTDLLYLMSNRQQSLAATGPFRKFAINAKTLSTETIEINEDMAEFNTRLSGYYKQLSDTWNEAQKEYARKVPELPNDVEHMEASKRIWIDIFENYFTRLFDSAEFAENFGKLVSSELEIAKHWNNMASTLLESANMPTKKDMDEVYKELHSLRKRVAKLEKIVNKGGTSNGQ